MNIFYIIYLHLLILHQKEFEKQSTIYKIKPKNTLVIYSKNDPLINYSNDKEEELKPGF